MFAISLAITFSGCILVTSIPYSLALTKIWTHNNDWGTVKNWNLGRLPCSNDIVKIELENTAVFINTTSSVKKLILPSHGSLVFGNSAQLLFSDGNSSPECKGSTIRFTGYGSNDWFDPNNWQTKTASDLALYPNQVPCKYDDVTFPKDSAYNVKVPKNVNVSKIVIGGKGQNETSFHAFQQYVASNNGIPVQQFDLGESVSFHITGKTCKDLSGCVCGINNKQRDYICNFITCPNIQCKHEEVKPLGRCCPICGTIVVLHISVGFNKTDIEKKIQDYLLKFVGIHYTAEKTEDRPNLIQVVLMDTKHLSDEESRTKMAAQSIRENLLSLSDKSILKIEIFPTNGQSSLPTNGQSSLPTNGQSSARKSGRNALTVGLAIGVPTFVAFIVIVLLLAYLVVRRKSRTSEPDESQIVQSERINPLYDGTIELENIGFSNALSPTEEVPENDDTSGRGNPLYEFAETT